jgi:hypothetical protein
MAELIRFVDERAGRKNIRAGHLVRRITRGAQQGHWVIDCPEVDKQLVVPDALVLNKEKKDG